VLHRVYRQSRRLKHSYAIFAAIALTSSVLLAPLWNLIEVLSLRATLTAILHIDLLKPLFAEDAVTAARAPLLFPYIWPFYAVILFAWASLYFGVNALIELDRNVQNAANAMKIGGHGPSSFSAVEFEPAFPIQRAERYCHAGSRARLSNRGGHGGCLEHVP